MTTLAFWILAPVLLTLVGAGAVFLGLCLGEAIALGRWP